MTADDPGYMEGAAALLWDAQAALDRKAEMEGVSADPAYHRSLYEERMRIAEALAHLEALRLGVFPAADARIAAALRFATYATTAEYKSGADWVIDQMVRALSGYPEDATMAGLGTSPAYERFREQVGEWDEGIAP